MPRQRPTIADLRAMRGRRQCSMIRVHTLEEVEAAESAGIDIVSVDPELMLDPRFRDAGPSLFAIPGVNFFEVGTADDFIHWAFPLYKAGADALYCSASLATVRRLADEGLPIVGHVGLVPSKRTWTGGFKAVGKTVDSALRVMEAVRGYEAAGAFGAEIEVVPDAITAEIAKRTSLFLISMGAGTAGHCQYLFAEDVLGYNRGHIPRHAKVYRNLGMEFDRLQAERVAAFSEFAADVASGAYPERKHLVEANAAEVDAFIEALDRL